MKIDETNIRKIIRQQPKTAYQGVLKKLEVYRFKLLLFFTLCLLILPPFIADFFLDQIIVIICLTFLFVQSVIAIADNRRKARIGAAALLILIIFTWLGPTGIKSSVLQNIKIVLYILFLGWIMISLLRFIIRNKKVTMDVILSAVIVYLIGGIMGGNLSMLLGNLYDHAFRYAATSGKIDLLDYIYFSFVTMTTLGYGDIAPTRIETQTMAYMMAIGGQLYLTIIIALLVGKYISHNSKIL